MKIVVDKETDKERSLYIASRVAAPVSWYEDNFVVL
jgi:hypothetical protein